MLAKEGWHECQTGCFRGTVDDLACCAEGEHEDSAIGLEYQEVVAYVRRWLKGW